jgi:hypothetical protein
MKTMLRVVPASLGIAIIAAVLAPGASAGCADVPARPAAALAPNQPSYLVQAAYSPARFVLVSDNEPSGAAIVGLWSVNLTSKGNPGIPDGAVVDWGYAQWHSDGTEIMNSGNHAPATQNFCLGVWEKTGGSTYKLNHFALSYDLVSGTFNGTVNIREQVTLDHRGNTFTGTFTIDVFPPGASKAAMHLAGEITGQRITAD